ncbi:MAG: ScpA family protein [Actinomycetota bacterium]
MAETSDAEVAVAEVTAGLTADVAAGPVPSGVQPADISPASTAAFGSRLTPGGVLHRADTPAFEVHLDVFQGPFELLLGLISKHKLDITEIALATVTDEFMAHIRAHQKSGTEWDLSQASEFLLVAATLLDIKSARLLPQLSLEDEDDLALIEARDLLFARLLQYRAFKEVASAFADRMATAGRMTARQAGLEPAFAALLPELVMSVSAEQLAMIAARAMTPKEVPVVGLEHLHAPLVSVREQAALIVERLRASRSCSFGSLVADAESTLVIVARFLALLELFHQGVIAFDQSESFAELIVRWTGQDVGEVGVSDEFDDSDDSDPPDDSDNSDNSDQSDDSDDSDDSDEGSVIGQSDQRRDGGSS